ncbi:hypothetical protein BD324DRAFT_621574 [Kockovaella imperatae]|uniref:RING-type domain-containing protein n=1 Tax=Kockovaella imperatae TaxID=4999 RepID=A0A1Y1UKM3_9TREE|nr:hypothetical protein BD324DRAFT_621574 [Kockovaella imperatae]ORX38610.1 hypothetical protein BD324DRAFT_621574 [Kockovaella imperatae]
MSRRSPLSLASLLMIPAIQTSILSSLPLHVSAYIPAVAVNDTTALNMTDLSTISIAWTDPPGVYSGSVSYQLQADVSTGGTTSGALVHFSESTMGPNRTTTTPWIAYVSCDKNETGDSMEWDIFTLARDRGAVSALLYTSTSQSCLLNQDYIQNFEKPLDVFATETVQVARVIDNQWTHTNNSFYWFNGTLLNISGTAVNESLAGNSPEHRTYLIGTLTARNSTGQAQPTEIPNPQPSASSPSGGGPPGSMIALYVILGIISIGFLLMLFLGARRALRHPERYGRREASDEQGPQTAARGLAQAILDTFPIIKFGQTPGANGAMRRKSLSSEAYPMQLTLPMYGNTDRGAEGDSVAVKSVFSDDDSVSLQGPSGRESMAGEDESNVHVAGSMVSSHGPMRHSRSRSILTPEGSRRTSKLDLHQPHGYAGEPRESGDDARPVRASHGSAPVDATDEAMLDQCPICLVDFEEGDDLRVLPCEAEHVYHQGCIDPWLLLVSASCPLCRKDFNQPLTSSPPATTETPQPHTPPSASSANSSGPPTQSGFAKYLAFMRRERGPFSANHGSNDSARPSPSSTSRRSRANTTATIDPGVGPGRRREADQTGPGGY